MRPVVALLLGVVTLWLQVAVVPHLAVFGYKPNLLLITVVLLGLRWVHPWLLVYAGVAGLAQDSFSHGLLGVYGLSFLAAAVLANLAGKLIYEQNALVIGLIVIAVSLVEGLVSLTILAILGEGGFWIAGFFGRVVPQAFLHGLLTPVVLIVVNRLDRRPAP